MACVDTGHGDLMGSEVLFLGWIVKTFRQRMSWPVGKWASAVMEESLATAANAHHATKTASL
jgi:hypothetical protein